VSSLILGILFIAVSIVSYATKKKFKEPKYEKYTKKWPKWYSGFLHEKMWIFMLIFGIIQLVFAYLES